jgi:hypothetical protein
MATHAGKIVTPHIGIATGNAADEMIAEVVERELPGFWAFLKARHPKLASSGAPDGPPIGHLHAFEVYDAMAETLPVYIRALRQAS